MYKLLTLLVTAAATYALLISFPGNDVFKGLAILLLIGVLWITEALPLTVTALMVPVVGVVFGVFDVKSALSHFANPIIFLFLGGFAIAAALNKHRIDVFLAGLVLRAGGNRSLVPVLLLFSITAGLSMWISNTATAAMMLPLAIGLLENMENKEDAGTRAFLFLGIAYSASIGGIGTLVGSPPNAITAAILGLTFRQWLAIGIPSVIVLLPLMVVVLYFTVRPKLARVSPEPRKGPGSGDKGILNKNSITVGIIFLIAVVLWLFSNPISSWLGIANNFDSMVALIAIFLLVASGVVQWKEIEDYTDWGVLLLFGGGLTLSAVLSDTGASTFLANKANETFGRYGALALIGGCVLLTIFLTEVASNTASAAIVVPIFYALSSETALLSPYELPLAAGIAASCAFMLPVATPPNALVYGTGYIKQRTMMSVGFRLNILFTIAITIIALLMF